MSSQKVGSRVSSSTGTTTPTSPSTTTIPVDWDHIQQALELCAGISEVDTTDATQIALKQLGAEFSSNIRKAITSHSTSILRSPNRTKPRIMPVVTDTPTERFKIRKRAAVTSEKLKVLKKAVSQAEKEIEAFTKNHGTGRPAIIPLEEAEQLVEKAEQSEGLKEMMSKIDHGCTAEVDEVTDDEE